jgi:hypothetical protein
LSKFDQPDPYDGSYDLTDPQSFNRYSYVQNDPVNFVDPTGLAMSLACVAIYGIEGQVLRADCTYDAPDRYLYGFIGYTPRDPNIFEPTALPSVPDENPSCFEFVNQLVDRVFKSNFFTKWGQGVGMETEAIKNPYYKKMPYSKGNPTNGFKDNLTGHGQDGDVYRHILFVAGAILAGDKRILGEFMGYDMGQAASGRKESLAEAADNLAGLSVGNLMSRAWDGKLNADALQSALRAELCK